ncbi:hypothetical protein [Leuconostoc citreum]|uniref:hypothetical protein n=1 Tax=Leuconostoc citreum TaxID=33964 RepID=UPI0031344F50
MDKAAINAIIKGIKEGAQAMTPLAKEYVHQVQMNGVVNIVTGIAILMLLVVSLTILFAKTNYSIREYAVDESGKALFVTIVSFAVLAAGGGIIYSGLTKLISPLLYILNWK